MPAQLKLDFSTTAPDGAEIILMSSDSVFFGLRDNSAQETLSMLAQNAEFQGKFAKYLPLPLASQTYLLAGVGQTEGGQTEEGIAEGALTSGPEAERWGSKLFSHLKAPPFNRAILDATSHSPETLFSILTGAMLASYHFDRYKTVKTGPVIDAHLTIISPHAADLRSTWDAQYQPLIEGVFTARDLVSEPANSLYPETFANHCASLASTGLEVEILDEDRLTALGMRALLGVGRGSAHSSYVVLMHWRGGAPDQPPLALVGKGVCFDSGGLSLKPPKAMEDMKWDMGGAAAVTGAMQALAMRQVKRHVIGIIGLVENMPDGKAQRPGDIVTSLSGQTVEVLNTDAEGRLVLADLLTYIQDQYAPQIVIDLATLTGAIISALGKEHAGLFSNDDALAESIIAAGIITGETCWRMPIGKSYDKLLKSSIADMKNIGGPYGGASTAACFLQRFIKDSSWAHLDIAGKAWTDKDRPTTPTGGTGFGVRLLNQLIDDWPDARTL